MPIANASDALATYVAPKKESGRKPSTKLIQEIGMNGHTSELHKVV